ncbi:MAG: tetratricopeptide repeat protein [Candidatus Omnitrophota bacterium]
MRYSKFLQVFFIIFLCLIIYGPSLGNGFIWDDDTHFYKNPLVQSNQGLKNIWFTHQTFQYYPLVFTAFWIEHKIWGFHPFGYHLVNLLFHILNALLLFWIVRKLYPRIAFVVALLFAIHPIQVETVAWITELKNLLVLAFFLLTILAYLRFDRTQKRKHYLQTIALFICALLSKTIAVCFVAVPILYAWWKKGRVRRREVRLSIPFMLIGFIAAINGLYLELYQVRARDAWSLSFLERFVLSGRILLFYIYKLCLPFKFMFFYPRWTIDAGQWWQWLFPFASMLLLVLLVYYRRRIGRGAPTLFLFYIISIFPVLGFINVYGMKFSFVADHFSYLSTPALLLLLCGGVVFLFDKLKQKLPLLTLTRFRIFAQSILVIVIVSMGTKSMALTKSYKNDVILWEDLIRKNPKTWIAYNNLGTAYSDIGKKEEAARLFKKAIELNPDCIIAYYDLANLYKDSGKTEEAIILYKKVIKIKPDYIEAYNNLGNTYNDIGEHKTAITLYKKAIEINPSFAEAYYNLGNAYSNISDSKAAIASYRKAIEFNLNHADVHNNLGNIYSYIGEYKTAITSYKKAIENNPNHANVYSNLGNVSGYIGEYKAAIAAYNKALEIDPDSAAVHNGLAVAHYHEKQYDLALKHCDRAIRLGYKVHPEFLKLRDRFRLKE